MSTVRRVVTLAAFVGAAACAVAEEEPAWAKNVEQTAVAIREFIVMGVAVGRRETVYVEFGVAVKRGTLVAASADGIKVKTPMAMISLPWRRVKPKRLYLIGVKYVPEDDAFMRLLLGQYCIVHGLEEEARKELTTAASLDPDLKDAVAEARKLLEVRAAAARKAREAASSARDRKSKKPEKKALPVTGKTAEVLKALGRTHFMVGVTSGPGAKWVKETQKQGCRWDMRYQYISGGVNKDHNWKVWNSPPGSFAAMYMRGSARIGVIPVFSWYQMYQSLPGGGNGGEAAVNKSNGENAGTMRQYLSDMKLFMETAGKFGKPVVLHVEPDLWGFQLISPEFRPNDPDSIRMMVKSSGLPDVADFEDTMAGFGKAIIHLRDTHAPNVLLGWHASHWGGPSAPKMAANLKKCGDWDIIFVDPSDRDSAWKVAHNYHTAGAWWKESDFVTFRNWCGQLHRSSGLPIIVWQIPVGNTIMAACNNTEGHYMDNRPQHWFEGYPRNTNILEWARAGVIALLFGGGAGGCTWFGDGCKDGVTNPTPVEGNKGEQSTWSDDDGGYLRMRGAAYYRSPLLFDLRPARGRKPAKRR